MLTAILHTSWLQLLQPHTHDQALMEEGFQMIASHYNEAHRHYHNVHHLHALLQLQQTHADFITDNERLSLAIFFHDIIYDVKQTDNEEQSALAAAAFLQQTRYPAEKTEQVMDFIRATKTHLNTGNDKDLDYFLDFDLSILSAPAADYKAYAQQIRNEYSIYPDELYKPGRKKVLTHFLSLPAIYKTSLFREEREALARQNMQEELTMLS
jgi:predicted metal-dependent HD superfamily phosphohydrolase